jgi:ferritin-like metal-binding protein YciE
MEVAMRLFSEKIPDLQSLYLRQLRLLLSAEGMIAIKTPHLLESTTDPELQQEFRQCIQESEARAERLRSLLNEARSEAKQPVKCKVIYALFDEAEELIEDAAHEPVRDAVILAAALRIKHYQIAAYGAMRQFAHALGHQQDVRAFDNILREEGQGSRHLSGIAERVNSTSVIVAA